MSGPIAADETAVGFPRYFRLCGRSLSAYKVFLCLGIYTGILVSAAVAERSGISPLAMGSACLACALAALIGARIYHLLVFAREYRKQPSWTALWDSRRGGWSLFGALLPMLGVSFLVAHAIGVPAAVFWDLMIFGIVAGAAWVRLGCICNGCCGGKETSRWFGVRLHDVRGVRKHRIPVQCMEIAWWLLAGIGLLVLSRRAFPPGAYALGVLAWYGIGRAWLEPLREAPDLVLGRVRIDQVFAAGLALTAGGGLLLLAFDTR